MENLIRQSRLLANRTSTEHIRQIREQIEWNWRLVGIKGARGVGKTTLLLQQMKLSDPAFGHSIYLPLDDLHFSSNSLRETVETLATRGITHFYLDEVHKYENWSREIKNIYDLKPDLIIYFTGSSIVELSRQNVDLSRRAVMYDMPGLSFREYLQVIGIYESRIYSLEEVLSNHEEIALEINRGIKPLQYFSSYLEHGYYPFFLESLPLFPVRLKQVVQLVLESDLASAEASPVQKASKIALLLQIVAESAPFTPNITKLAERSGLDRNTLLRYLHHLERAELTASLYRKGKGITALQKPEKLYLDNTNLSYTLAPYRPDMGNLRETFFYNQLRRRHLIQHTDEGDFMADNKFTVEVGGKNKKASQVKHLSDHYIAADDIEVGVGRQIPLWLFGFLY
ncbi:MAG: ATP-binding protein [Phaeodactylibacter sp.]|nr:ATP-binding protein [Phaeodactylibacter sp.]MCB9295982.1 ATP-binding protein [Lewinellaceae bacterium]